VSNDRDTDVAGRLQQTIAAAAILGVGVWVAYVSFSVRDPQPYLFPQLISVVMLALAGFALVRALMGTNRTGTGMSIERLVAITPALLVMLLYIFVLIPALGFYAAATVAFFTLYTVYDPTSHKKPSTWLTRIVVTAGFMALIYLVFALGLRVQTPRGLFI
jgi:Tripartite tricarboxylate transporter TctB family